jgi:hypothetical protein
VRTDREHSRAVMFAAIAVLTIAAVIAVYAISLLVDAPTP